MSGVDPCKLLVAGRKTALQAEGDTQASELSSLPQFQKIKQLHEKYATQLDLKTLFAADPNRGKNYR